MGKILHNMRERTCLSKENTFVGGLLTTWRRKDDKIQRISKVKKQAVVF